MTAFEKRFNSIIRLKDFDVKYRKNIMLDICHGESIQARTELCDEFRNLIDDKYVAIKVDKGDVYAWSYPQYPTKIAFRKGLALYECDRDGNKI